MKPIGVIGTKANAVVFTNEIEPSCLQQIREVVNETAAEGSSIRIMPDCHAGKGCVVGFTMPLTDKVVPNLVGVDIGCGVSWVNVPENIKLNALDDAIKANIPSGFGIREDDILINEYAPLLNGLTFKLHDRSYIEHSLGSLGGGNHFIEVDKSEETGKYYLLVHSGSRNLGVQVCKYWQEIADNSRLNGHDTRQSIIEKLKLEHREKEISAALIEFDTKFKGQKLHYLTGENMKGYLNDMRICQKFASYNRYNIIRIISKRLGLPIELINQSVHNDIDFKTNILRKGAVSAYGGDELVIPLNMRDGTLYCRGKGNWQWNYSAPHGAGRCMSRKQAKEQISLKDYEEAMQGIYSSTVCKETLDEAPFAYKNGIEELIGDTVDVLEHWKPIYNFKAKEQEPLWSKDKKAHERKDSVWVGDIYNLVKSSETLYGISIINTVLIVAVN